MKLQSIFAERAGRNGMSALWIAGLLFASASTVSATGTANILQRPGYVITLDGPDGFHPALAAGTGSTEPSPPTVDSRAAASKARRKWMESTTPVTGSPEWKKEEEDNNRYEKQIDRMIKGICKGC